MFYIKNNYGDMLYAYEIKDKYLRVSSGIHKHALKLTLKHARHIINLINKTKYGKDSGLEYRIIYSDEIL